MHFWPFLSFFCCFGFFVCRLQLHCGYRIMYILEGWSFLGEINCDKISINRSKSKFHMRSSHPVVIVSTITSQPSPPLFFFSQNEDDFILKPLLYSSILVHSHYPIGLNLPISENGDVSTGEEHLFCISKYVISDLLNRDHLSTWRQTIVTDTAHEEKNGLSYSAWMNS